MPVQITIIGLGQIGASIGLALAAQKEQILRIGHDKDTSIAKRARQIGAVDRIENNLHAAVENADLVLLALPVDQLRATLEWIGPDLRESAVVMDTAPVKAVVIDWVKQYLPPERHYLGFTPVINPKYLQEAGTGIGAAHADLFTDGLFAIVSPLNTPSEAIKLATDLAHLLGASAYFADAAELDGLMASTHLVPQLLAAALLDITVDQPGWTEARRVAGKAFTQMSGVINISTYPQTLATTATSNRQNTIRLLDNAIAALQSLRDTIQDEDEQALAERFKRLQAGYMAWLEKRQAGGWNEPNLGGTQYPKTSEILAGMFGVRRKPKTK